MTHRSGARTDLVAFVLAATLACGGDGGSVTDALHSGPGVHIVSSRTADDTIEALLPSGLTVQVRDAAGKPKLDVRVTLASYSDQAGAFGATMASFSLMPLAPGVTALSEVTDARGQLTVSARLGGWAGSGWITVDAGALGRDSIHVVVRPGAPARLSLAPRDTALAVGASYTLAAVVGDRRGNSVVSVPALATRRASVAAVTAALTVRSFAPGHAVVVGSLGTAVDSVDLEVVPSGTLIALTHAASGHPPAIVTVDLDGSHMQRVPLVSLGFNNFSPRWIPQQNMLVFHASTASYKGDVGMFTVGASSQPQVLYAPTAQASGMYPQPSRDGTWIYYTQQVGWQSSEVWRMRPDGSARARVGQQAGYYDDYSQPSPSPDGRSLAYTQNDGGTGSGVVRLNRLDLTTGTSSFLGAFGTHPRWSPVANEIAYLTGSAVRIVQADGTGDRVLATGQQYGFEERDGQLDWSPDGNWLVACVPYVHSDGRRLVLIERATGEVMPLPFSFEDNLCEATWIR